MSMTENPKTENLRQRLQLLNLSELARRSQVPWHRIRDFAKGKTAKLREDDVRKIEDAICENICNHQPGE